MADNENKQETDAPEMVWVVWDEPDNDLEEPRVVTTQAEADSHAAAGHKVQPFAGVLDAPEPKAPLHSVSIKAKGSSPHDCEILIDGRKPITIQSLQIDLGIKHANRCTITFEPEILDVEGTFEGWARPTEKKSDDDE